MPEHMISVRATEATARQEAMRAADRLGLYVTRIVAVVPVGPWTESEDGTVLFDVTVQGDHMPEGEARGMDGNR